MCETIPHSGHVAVENYFTQSRMKWGSIFHYELELDMDSSLQNSLGFYMRNGVGCFTGRLGFNNCEFRTGDGSFDREARM